MNCLKIKNLNTYFKTLESLEEKELITEFKKNLCLTNKIEYSYNILRSHIYIDFIDKLQKIIDDKKDVNSKKLEEIILDGVKWCTTYMTICFLLESIEKEEEIDVSTKDILNKTKDNSRRLFLLYNSLSELCVICKNHALYLSKKILNKSNYYFDQYVSYDGEIYFENEEEIKRFEKNNLIKESGETKTIIKQVIESLMIEITCLDRNFATNH